MSFPALDAFAADRRVRPSTFRLYMFLQRECLSHAEPREVKIWHLKARLAMGATQIVGGLNWLIAAGYLVEHARGSRGVRSLSLAWSIRPDHSRNGNDSAA